MSIRSIYFSIVAGAFILVPCSVVHQSWAAERLTGDANVKYVLSAGDEDANQGLSNEDRTVPQDPAFNEGTQILAGKHEYEEIETRTEERGPGIVMRGGRAELGALSLRKGSGSTILAGGKGRPPFP